MSTNQKGVISGQAVVIVGAVTLVLAAIIIAIFIFLKPESNKPSADYQNYLNELQRQKRSQETPESTERAIVRQTFRGVLTAFTTESVTITEEANKQLRVIALGETTTVTYQNQPFARSRFYVGDQLEITAREEGVAWQAETVIVLISASPATPVPVPVTPNVSPSGSFRPLGVE